MTTASSSESSQPTKRRRAEHRPRWGSAGPGHSPPSSDRRGRRPSRLLGLGAVVAAAAVLAGCSAGGSGKEAAGAPAPPPNLAPPSDPGPSAALASPSAGASPSALRPGVSTPRGGSGAASPRQQKPPFAADTNPDVSTAQAGRPVLVSVTKARRVGYDRYIFEFTNDDPDGHAPLGARPAWDVRYVSRSEAVMDGSGRPVPVGGASVLRIQFNGAAMHWDDGRSSLRRSVPDHDALSFGGDFEGQVTWFLGRDQKRPFRAVFLGHGRVAVDVVS